MFTDMFDRVFDHYATAQIVDKLNAVLASHAAPLTAASCSAQQLVDYWLNGRLSFSQSIEQLVEQKLLDSLFDGRMLKPLQQLVASKFLTKQDARQLWTAFQTSLSQSSFCMNHTAVLHLKFASVLLKAGLLQYAELFEQATFPTTYVECICEDAQLVELLILGSAEARHRSELLLQFVKTSATLDSLTQSCQFVVYLLRECLLTDADVARFDMIIRQNSETYAYRFRNHPTERDLQSVFDLLTFYATHEFNFQLPAWVERDAAAIDANLLKLIAASRILYMKPLEKFDRKLLLDVCLSDAHAAAALEQLIQTGIENTFEDTSALVNFIRRSQHQHILNI